MMMLGVPAAAGIRMQGLRLPSSGSRPLGRCMYLTGRLYSVLRSLLAVRQMALLSGRPLSGSVDSILRARVVEV